MAQRSLNCRIEGIKAISTTPSAVSFQVQYFIPPTYAPACFISAYLPNSQNQAPNFAFVPAGILPAGVPKGEHGFNDNIAFSVQYTGQHSYVSSTLEVVIYDQDQKTLCSKKIYWGQTWAQGNQPGGQGQAQCQIQGIKNISATPSEARFQVQYNISASYPRACFIGAYIPNRAAQMGTFAYTPAGLLPNGVPKGQHYFADNVVFGLTYTGSQAYTSSTVEVVIYDQDNKDLCSTILNWGQTWNQSGAQCQIQGIKEISTSGYQVQFQVQYNIPASYNQACYIGAHVPNTASPNRSISYIPAGRPPIGVPKGQHYFADNVTFNLKYNGTSTFTSSTLEVFIYDSNNNLCSEVINWSHTWSTPTNPRPAGAPSGGKPAL